MEWRWAGRSGEGIGRAPGLGNMTSVVEASVNCPDATQAGGPRLLGLTPARRTRFHRVHRVHRVHHLHHSHHHAGIDRSRPPRSSPAALQLNAYTGLVAPQTRRHARRQDAPFTGPRRPCRASSPSRLRRSLRCTNRRRAVLRHENARCPALWLFKRSSYTSLPSWRRAFRSLLPADGRLCWISSQLRGLLSLPATAPPPLPPSLRRRRRENPQPLVQATCGP